MISIIIPRYYSQLTISECLRSLTAQKTEEKFEILVINSSSDETHKIVREYFPTVQFIQLKKRVFAGAARNIGIQKSQGDRVAFIDADCIPSSDWLSKIISWHRKGYRVVGGSIANGSHENIFSKAEYPLEILEFSPRNAKREVKFVSAANCSFSREIFDNQGLFPDIRAGEDLVLCHKIAEKGEKIIFDPDIKVSHKNEINFKQYVKKQIMHGKHSYEIRQMEKLSGSFMNNPLVLSLLLPLFPFIRAMRVIWRSIHLKNKLMYDIMSTFPLFFLGCVMWSSGYAKGYAEQLLNRKEL
ncbi:MAG: glycosyltransferase [Candidatus Aminicenantes bacterium]|nr:MAG: glycosyltransferase [Candidatus Aminicenantes bacterium]